MGALGRPCLCLVQHGGHEGVGSQRCAAVLELVTCPPTWLSLWAALVPPGRWLQQVPQFTELRIMASTQDLGRLSVESLDTEWPAGGARAILRSVPYSLSPHFHTDKELQMQVLCLNLLPQGLHWQVGLGRRASGVK